MNKRHKQLAPVSDLDFLKADYNRIQGRESKNGKLENALRIGGVVLAAATVMVVGARATNNGDSEPFDGAPTTVETIKHGDTLWKKARSFADEQGTDIRDVVADIQQQSPDVADGLHPGDQIVRPVTQAEIAQRDDPETNG